MLKNYLKITIRNIIKHKAYSLINITGLVIGMVCFMLVMLWVKYEFSYDRYIVNSDRIFRLAFEANLGETNISSNNVPGLLGKDMMANYSGIEQYVRFGVQYNSFVSYKETVFNERELAFADKNVFEFFQIPMISGDPKTALAQPNTVCLSERIAKKYFGNEDPIGKIMVMNKNQSFTITGIFKDFPENSHIDRTMLASFETVANDQVYNTWDGFNCITYLLVKEGFNPGSILDKYSQMIVEKVRFDNGKQAFTNKDDLKLYSVKLSDIHLFSNRKDEFKSNGDITQIYIFSSIAVFILVIACINFINLSTAKSLLRAKEVAIRKTIGSNKIQLVKQFLGESIFLSTLAMIISLVVLEILLPGYRKAVGRNIEIHYFDNFYTIPFILSIILCTGILSGLYPAFFLSSFKPVIILKGKIQNERKGFSLRNILVIFQFSISIVFFIGTIVINNQLDYLRKKELGFNRENVLVLYTPESYHDRIEVFRQKLLQNQAILSVSNSHTVPASGADFSQRLFKPEGKEALLFNTCECDYDYLKTFNMKMVQGRFFSREYSTDTSSAIVINESAVKLLGWTDPVGKIFYYQDEKPYTVVGVVKDFNFESLHNNIRPMAFRLNVHSPESLQRFISVRISPGNYSATIDFIKRTFKEISPSLNLWYSFLDDRYNRLYNNEKETGAQFLIFSILAIFVSCLGLLGLVTFSTERRTKEVAVRKILGANISELFFLLSKESLKWVITANLLAWPVAYLVMSKWLGVFAFRISMGFFEFVIAGCLALFIAIGTLSFQIVKISTSNPVDSLKYE
jgi:putative ABC transport system permease protein